MSATDQVNPRDLETIVTLLEIAALCLTSCAESTFTKKQLIEEARKFGVDSFNETDFTIVLSRVGFLKKTADGKFRLR